MPSESEKSAFSKRLRLAMRRASPTPVDGATELAAGLSERITDGISVQTAHKWLTGRTIPKPDKTSALAEWLNVNEHWLRYGPARSNNRRNTEGSLPPPAADTLNLARQIQALDPHKRYLVEELVGQLFLYESQSR